MADSLTPYTKHPRGDLNRQPTVHANTIHTAPDTIHRCYAPFRLMSLSTERLMGPEEQRRDQGHDVQKKSDFKKESRRKGWHALTSVIVALRRTITNVSV